MFRQYESGNNIKEILGTPQLVWDTKNISGVYEGKTFDHLTDCVKVEPKETYGKATDRFLGKLTKN